MAGWTLSEVILTDVELRAGKTVVDGGMRVLQNKDKLNAMSNGVYEDYEEGDSPARVSASPPRGWALYGENIPIRTFPSTVGQGH